MDGSRDGAPEAAEVAGTWAVVAAAGKDLAAGAASEVAVDGNRQAGLAPVAADGLAADGNPVVEAVDGTLEEAVGDGRAPGDGPAVVAAAGTRDTDLEQVSRLCADT